MAITAIGIDAETVSPAFKARYTVAAPKMTPKRLPNKMDFTVSSFIIVCGETKGRNAFFSSIGKYFLGEEDI